MDTIDSFSGTYRFLSNFYVGEEQLVYAGRPWNCVETPYQAMKASTAEDYLWVAATRSPGEAKRRGRRLELRHDWESIKCVVMGELLLEKFQPNTELAERLLATGGATLIEGNTWGDRYWGVCAGTGKNMLGQMLMDVRSFLKTSRRPPWNSSSKQNM